jgi:hypothetical protein
MIDLPNPDQCPLDEDTLTELAAERVARLNGYPRGCLSLFVLLRLSGVVWVEPRCKCAKPQAMLRLICLALGKDREYCARCGRLTR